LTVAPGIDSVGVITRGRPTSVARAVRSFAENIRASGRVVPIVVCDDSRDGAEREENRRVLSSVATQFSLPDDYVDSGGKQRLIRSLAAEGLSPAIVGDALLSERTDAYGTNRNTLQLVTVGQLTLSIDDDMVCRLIPQPAALDTPAVAAVAEDDLYFFASSEEAQTKPTVAVDFLGLHERWLGHRLGDALGEFKPEEIEFSAASMPADGRTLLTKTGVIGDSGLASPHWLLFARGESFARLIASPSSYHAASTSRQMMRVVRRATIAAGGV